MPCCACIPTISQAIFTIVAFTIGKWILAIVRSNLGGGNKEPKIRKTDWKRDVVYLYQFPRSPTVPNVSPYCLKLETWLRVNKIPFEVIESYLTRSKYGRMPFIELNGRHIADSQLIIWELQKHFKTPTEENSERGGISRAIDRMIEASTFYVLVYWKVYKNTAKFLSAGVFGGPFPNFLRSMLALRFRTGVKTGLDNQGYGKFAESDLRDILHRDIQAIDALLGDNDYIGGDRPCIADSTIFGHLASCQYIAIEHPLKDLLGSEFPRVKQHLERMREAFWPDWDAPKAMHH